MTSSDSPYPRVLTWMTVVAVRLQRRDCRVGRAAPNCHRTPSSGSGATDRPTAKAVWIIDLPEDDGPTHLMHHRPGFACSCDDLKISGAVNKTFTANYRQVMLRRNMLQHN
jgi:hypothetical protein